MPLHIAAISLVYAFQQSDLFGRFIVLLLAAASTLAWSILVEKWVALRQTTRETQAFIDAFRGQKGPLPILIQHETLHGPLKAITSSCVDSMADLFEMTRPQLLAELRANRIPRFLSDAEIERLSAAMSEATDVEIVRLEARLGLLATIVSASPFLGLLGTVWGVMVAFTGMAQKGKVEIAAIAPGVSGALLTTVVGLLVAIPALFGFNLLTGQVRTLTVQMDNYQETLTSLLKTHFQPGPEGA